MGLAHSQLPTLEGSLLPDHTRFDFWTVFPVLSRWYTCYGSHLSALLSLMLLFSDESQRTSLAGLSSKDSYSKVYSNMVPTQP